MTDAKGWYSRGYLPHFDAPDRIQAITFRLADSLPAEVVGRLAADRTVTAEERRRRIAAVLDRGLGSCALNDPRVAALVEEALLTFDGTRYRLLAWTVMPNHVHVVLVQQLGHQLPRIVKSWKAFTAAKANCLLGRTGQFWQPDYFDRVVRNERHLAAAIHYVEMNPVKAGLVLAPEEWPYGSARRRTIGGGPEGPPS